VFFVDLSLLTPVAKHIGVDPELLADPTRPRAQVLSLGRATDRPPSGSPAPEAPRDTSSVLP
jgi:hypothetical protein